MKAPKDCIDCGDPLPPLRRPGRRCRCAACQAKTRSNYYSTYNRLHPERNARIGRAWRAKRKAEREALNGAP